MVRRQTIWRICGADNAIRWSDLCANSRPGGGHHQFTGWCGNLTREAFANLLWSPISCYSRTVRSSRIILFDESDTTRFGWSFIFAFMGYGAEWRLNRRIFHQSFQKESALRFRPMQIKSAREMILNLMEEPHHYYSHFTMSVGARLKTELLLTCPQFRVFCCHVCCIWLSA